jgi:hypothetical protein
MVHRRQTGPLCGMVKSAQWLVPQGERAAASFHMGPGALEDLREPVGLGLEVVVRQEAEAAQRSAGLQAWGAQALGQGTPRLPLCHGRGCGHARQVLRRHEMGVQSVGRGRRSLPLTPLLSPIPRDARPARLHVRHYPFRCGEALQAALTTPCGLGHGTDGVDVLREGPGKAFAVAAYAALHVDKVGGVAEGAQALGALRARRSAPLGLVASRVHVLRPLRQPRCHRGEAPWACRAPSCANRSARSLRAQRG